METAEPVHVLGLQAEDFMRLKVVHVEFTKEGVTRIVGRNGQGKTSLLNALSAALGGTDFSVDEPIRKGASKAEVVVDLGEIIVRKVWKQGTQKLEVTTKKGEVVASPQMMLNRIIGKLTFDPLAFTRLKPVEQVEVLAKLANLNLAKMAAEKKELYEQRRQVGRERDNLQGAYKALQPVEAPAEEVSVADLMAELERIDKVNREKALLQRELAMASRAVQERTVDLQDCQDNVEKAKKALQLAEEHVVIAQSNLQRAQREEATGKQDFDAAAAEDPAPVKQKIADSQSINAKVRHNKSRAVAKANAEAAQKKYDTMTAALEGMDAARANAVTEAKLPVPGLGLSDDGVTLNGVPFSQGSQAEQLKASVAIGFALNPKLKICLIRDGSLLDADSMNLLAKMAKDAGAQVLVERVAAAGESGILIEDGEVVTE